MQASDELFLLIKSLNKQEKRHFKIFSKRYLKRAETFQVALFNIIDRQKAYDEVKVKKLFSGTKLPKRLSVEKVRLRNTILKSLNNLYFDNSLNRKISEEINETAILINKGFYASARKALKKLKVQAYELVFYAEILRIIGLEKSMQVNIGDTHQYLDQLIQEEFEVIQSMKRGSELKNMMNKMHQLYYCINFKKPVPEYYEQIESIMRSELIHPVASSSFLEKAIINNINSLYCLVHRDFQGAFRWSWENYILYRSHPLQIIAYTRGYAHALNDLANSATLVGDKKNAQLAFKLLRTLYEKEISLDMKSHILNIIYLQELYHYLVTKQYDKALSLALDVEKTMDKMKKEDMVIPDKALIYDNLIHTFIIHREIKKALKWTYRLLEENTSTIKDVNARGRLYLLILYYEMYNLDDIDYLLKHKFKAVPEYKAEQFFINFFKDVVRSKKPEKELLDQLIRDLEALRDVFPENQILQHFDFISWAESKRYGKPFEESLRKK